ncbi:unnamed protein product [Musa acuminata subsp. malaccensis]|uniref:(wild Malaysian banana) hypothetical protein n=1 Tax=Musa acuminata subsp. malaccensis TaxID=214687 RepID=A0A804HWM2_MUSAM|nr:unnamed protein product [Musa acuminata subsp. malaccensis]
MKPLLALIMTSVGVRNFWEAKENSPDKGPSFYNRKANHMDQREKSNPRHYSEPTSAMYKSPIEKAKQDDTLSDFSDVLGQLKGMALDMSTEMDRQNKALVACLA